MDRECFAERDGSLCDATEDGLCLTYDCPFYTTEKQHRQSVEQAYARIRGLPQEQQDQISEKYYKGRKPWIK